MAKTQLKRTLKISMTVLVMVVVFLTMKFSVRHFSNIENRTPIPPGPELSETVTEPSDHSKINNYEQELEEQQKAAFKKEPDLQAVSIPWDKVFAKDSMSVISHSDTMQSFPMVMDDTNPKDKMISLKTKTRDTFISDTKDPHTYDDQMGAPGFNTVKPEKTPKINNHKDHEALILAVVHGDQKVKHYQPVSFRVIEDIEIGEWQIPKNTIIYGKALVDQNRVLIQSERIKTPSEILHLPLHCLDKDLMEGLLIKTDELVSNSGTIAGEIIDEVAVYEYNGIVRSITSAFRRPKDRSIWLVDGYQVYFYYKSD